MRFGRSEWEDSSVTEGPAGFELEDSSATEGRPGVLSLTIGSTIEKLRVSGS